MTAAVCTAPDANWALVERAQAGDRDAFAEIYRRYEPMIAGWIYKHTGNADLTKDLTADVFVKALRRIGTVEWQGRDIGAWLHVVARNRLSDYRKSAAHRLTAAVADVGADRPDGTHLGEPEAAGDRLAIRTVLLAAIKNLSPAQREVIELRFLRDMSLTEVTDLVGSNVAAVKNRQHRALVRLASDRRVRDLVRAA